MIEYYKSKRFVDSVANDTNSERTIINSETKKYEKCSFGWLREQAKKDGFDDIRDWQKYRIEQQTISRYRQSTNNIDQVENILEENKIEIKNSLIFYKFWSIVDIKDNKEECWNWIAATTVKGYGRITIGINKILAHRLAYTITKGPIPDGLQIQHLCNNRRCCNPNHLELGNDSKNMQYKSKCGRCNSNVKGENYGGSKLTEDQVREIHKLYNEQRNLHYRPKQWQIIEPIAKKFEVSQPTINMIINGKIWIRIYEEFHQN